MVVIGKEAGILIRLLWTDNNTFILGDAGEIKLRARTKGQPQSGVAASAEGMIDRISPSAIAR